MTTDRRIARRVYAAVLAPWFLLGIIGPWQLIAGLIVAGALVLGVAGWLTTADHVTIERDP